MPYASTQDNGKLKEREVREDDPMPKNYRFVPKGNVYITQHCRKKTHEAAKPLYVVFDKKNKPIGLRCPASIYRTVMNKHEATATQRAEAVQKRDAAAEDKFEEAIVKLFPHIPKAEVSQIIKHSLKKHSRRVGRTNTVALSEKVKLAVRAHIRHVHTDYDKLLKQDVSRTDAREKVWERLNEVARKWGGRPLKPAAAMPAKERRIKKTKVAAKSSTNRKKTKTGGTVKKAAVFTARVTTRRMSEEALDPSPPVFGPRVRTRRMTRGLALSGDVGELGADVNGVRDDVDDLDMVFSMDEEMSEYDSDGSIWNLSG